MVHEVRRIDGRRRTELELLADSATLVDGVRPISEQALLNLDAEHPGQQLHVLALAGADRNTADDADEPDHADDADDTVIGYAQLDRGDGATELVVHPEHRRQGVATALLQALRAETDSVEPRIWAHGFIDAAQAFASARGLRVVRELWQMTLQVTQAPEPAQSSLPPGFVVRPFTVADLDDWLAVNARAFTTHPEQGRITAPDVRDRMAQPWFDPQGFLLVRDKGAGGAGEADGAGTNGRLAAYHWTKIDPSEQPPTGEVYVVGIDPDYQGRGLARPVTAIGLQHLISQGVDRITLYVEGDNERAIATYLGAGFERTALDVMLAG